MKKILFFITALLLMGGLNANAENATLNNLEAAYGTTSDWLNVIPKSYPVNVLDNVIFGSDASAQTTNANVNNYDYIYFEVSDFVSERAVRVFFWDPTVNKRIDYYLKPVADKETADYSVSTTVSAAGTYCVKIPDGARLQGAKTPWTSSPASEAFFKFSEIYLTERETPYVELIPYTLKYSEGKAIIPISESHIRTTGNVSINYETGEITNTGSGTLVIYLNNENLIGATRYHVDITGTNLEPVLNITDDKYGEVGGIYNSRFNWNIANDAARKDKVGEVTAFTYVFSSDHKGSMTFTSIFIEANELIAETSNKDIASLPYGVWTMPANKVGSFTAIDAFCTNNIDGAAHDAVLYGHDGNGDANKYVDLTNCTKIYFTGFSSNGVIRLFYNWSGTDADKPIEIIEDFPKENGTYVFDINEFKKKKGISFFHLNGIKSQWAPVTLSSVTVDEYTCKISGEGISRINDYITNSNITFTDATGVTATGLNVAPANQNSLFKAPSAETFANATSVIVEGVCASLNLVDGGGTFKTPEAFDATYVALNRNFVAGKVSTVCLPFALTEEEVEAAGEFYTLTGVEGSELVFEKVATTEAYKPYLFKANVDGCMPIVASKAIAVTPASCITEQDGYTFKGVLADCTDVAGDNPGMTVYGWSASDGSFVEVGKDVSINGFRAYVTISNVNASQARLAARFVDSSVTGVNEVNGEAKAQFGDGKYVIGNNVVIVKNGKRYNVIGGSAE